MIGIVQKALVRSSTFRSQVSPEILAEMEEADAKERDGEGNRPTGSATGDSTSNP